MPVIQLPADVFSILSAIWLRASADLVGSSVGTDRMPDQGTPRLWRKPNVSGQQ
jgi:hypothetical protein